MKSYVSRLFIALAVITAGAWLFWDATTVALRAADPAIGRGRGCYTDLELAFGATHPHEWVRLVELGGGGLLVALPLWVEFRRRWPK